jgi:hypothetical protein
MPATLAERSSLPFHLSLTELIDETTIADIPAVEGAYDPVAQIWRLPDGTPLTDPNTSPNFSIKYTICGGPEFPEVDDIHPDE